MDITSVQNVINSAVTQKVALSSSNNAVPASQNDPVAQPSDTAHVSNVSGKIIEASTLYDASLGLAGLNSQLEIARSGTQAVTTTLQNLQNIVQQIITSGNTATLTSLEAEFQSLYSQIDKTVSGTSFNGSSLLDGTFAPDNSTGSFIQGGGSGQNPSPSLIPNLGTQGLFGATPLNVSTPGGASDALSAIAGAQNLVEGVSGNIDTVSNQVNFAMASIETAQANNYAAASTITEGELSFLSQLMNKPSASAATQASKMSDSTLKLLNK